MIFIGVVFGALSMLRWADVIGRKPILVLGLVFEVVSWWCIVFVESRNARYALLFLFGIGASPRFALSYLMCLEMIPIRYKIHASTVIGVYNSLITAIGGIYCLVVSRNMKYLEIFGVSLSSFLLIVIFVVLPESPKFYYAKGRYDEARAVFSRIAWFNGAPHFKHRFDAEEVAKSELDQISKRVQERASLKKLCRSSLMVRNLFMVLVCWVGVFVNQNTLLFALKGLNGNIFYNHIMFGVGSAIATVFSGVIAQRIGVKNTLTISFLIAAAFAFMLYFIDT